MPADAVLLVNASASTQTVPDSIRRSMDLPRIALRVEPASAPPTSFDSLLILPTPLLCPLDRLAELFFRFIRDDYQYFRR
jgi:hypothetical protein